MSAWAEAPKNTAEHFRFSLTSLKESMLRLEQGNNQLRQENDRIRQNVQQLQKNFDQVAKEGEKRDEDLKGLLNKAQQKIQQQAQLKGDLDAVATQLSAINPAYQEKQERVEQLQKELGMVSSSLSQPEVVPEAVHEKVKENSVSQANVSRQEKLKLLKMILESQHRQQVIQGDIFEVKKSSNRAIDVVAQLKAKQDFLQKKKDLLLKNIADAAAAVVEPPVLAPPQEEFSESQFKAVIQEIADLRKKHGELLALTRGMPKRGKNNGSDDSKAAEAGRLEASIAALKKENKILKQQVKELRVQMVGLDKKKIKQEQLLKMGR